MDDVAKVAIPVILYRQYSVLMKVTHSVALFAVVYSLLATARLFREKAEEM